MNINWYHEVLDNDTTNESNGMCSKKIDKIFPIDEETIG